MKQNAATPNRAIRIVTAIYLVATVGICIGGFFQPMLFLVGVILALIAGFCYFFWTPLAYELSGDNLTVFFRASQKTFPDVTRCSVVEGRFPFSIRLCGDGGLFAGSGFFWNKPYGIFRAYVTQSKPPTLVLVETRNRKIAISPADPQTFIQSAPMR